MTDARSIIAQTLLASEESSVYEDADAVLAALAEAGYVLCREQVGWLETRDGSLVRLADLPFDRSVAVRPVYVPVAVDDRYPE